MINWSLASLISDIIITIIISQYRRCYNWTMCKPVRTSGPVQCAGRRGAWRRVRASSRTSRRCVPRRHAKGSAREALWRRSQWASEGRARKPPIPRLPFEYLQTPVARAWNLVMGVQRFLYTLQETNNTFLYLENRMLNFAAEKEN